MSEPEFAWTQDSWGPEDVSGADRASARRRERLAWLGVFALAVVAFEVTADPALSTALGCLKFGWEEVRVSWWLRRADPDRLRGRICSRFYLASGLWRVSLVASAMMFLIAIGYGLVEKHLGVAQPAGGPPPGFISAALLAFLGFGLSSLVSIFAAFSAFRRRVSVWVGPEARWALEEKVWPPHQVAPRRLTTNRTRIIVASGLITSSIVGLVAFIIFLSTLLEPGPGPGRRPAGEAGVGVALMLFALVAVPVLVLVLAEALGKRVYAATPEACWGDGSRLQR